MSRELTEVEKLLQAQIFGLCTLMEVEPEKLIKATKSELSTQSYVTRALEAHKV